MIRQQRRANNSTPTRHLTGNEMEINKSGAGCTLRLGRYDPPCCWRMSSCQHHKANWAGSISPFETIRRAYTHYVEINESNLQSNSRKEFVSKTNPCWIEVGRPSKRALNLLAQRQMLDLIHTMLTSYNLATAAGVSKTSSSSTCAYNIVRATTVYCGWSIIQAGKTGYQVGAKWEETEGRGCRKQRP